MNKYEHIKQEAFEANCQLPGLGLVLFTFGNVSAADKSLGVFAIKPSGMLYEKLSPGNMVIVDFEGKKVEGALRPSSDTLTHAVLYKQWENIGGIAHTHSIYATAWAQALRSIPLYGTTHADYTTGNIPCTTPMSDEAIKDNGYNYEETEMILVGSHAPFTWGKNAAKAVHNSAVLEYIAKMATLTEQVNPQANRLKEALIKKHFERKHGPDSYYGQ